jgi:hypothetical protein
VASQHTPPLAPFPHGGDDAPRHRIVQAMLAQSRPLLEHVVEAARIALQSRQDSARTSGEHQAMLEARQRLTQLAPVMAERYPDALRKALAETGAAGDDKPTRSLFTIHFDELELMDETQINDSVERARARQMLMSAVEGPLADLDALVSGALGAQRVQPEHNPLRPDVFLQALQAVVSQMQVTAQVRHDWMGPLAQALGAELRKLYLSQIDQLKESGVQPAGYAMRQASGEVVYVAPASGGATPGFASDSDLSAASASGDSLLTLERLRRLLQGEFSDAAVSTQAPRAPQSLASPDPSEPFSVRFDREFEHPDTDALPRIDPPPTDFAATVPAAFEALQEMNQVGHMMERLGNQRAQPGSDPAVGDNTVRRKPAGSLGQALSMEVVSLMVDNIARDTRLLWPVQQFIRALEPALMQLALADPRFFSHKEHAARRLLQDITDRGLAFASTEDAGFQSFMRSLMNIAGPLATATIEGPEDFEQALSQLHAKWEEKEQARKQERLRAIEALQHAEQRHLLAAKISREIWLLPDIGKVPDEVSRFLLGPWAQVMAEARLAEPGTADPGRYQEALEALIWSAQPEQTRANTGRLARLLPKLLAKLREGLATIDYPAARTEAVFELLMQLHQQAFKPGPRVAAPPPVTPSAPAPAGAASPTQGALLEDDDPWVAPSEAKESGFMDALQSESPDTSPVSAPSPMPPSEGATDPAVPGDASALSGLVIGTWVNLQVGGKWERTQLSWIGSHGNLFLFTSASGRTQSMTLRLVERLVHQGAMCLLTQHPVVDGALDAVAQVAMRNSVESRL